MASWLYKQIKKPAFVMHDAIDKELHPNVRAFFYQAYLGTVKSTSQLLFATHTFYLLDAPCIQHDILWETKMGAISTRGLNPSRSSVFQLPTPPRMPTKGKCLGNIPNLEPPTSNLEKMGITGHIEKYDASGSHLPT